MELTTAPVEWANYISIFGFLFLAVLVWLIPRRLVYSGAPDQALWRDLRLWASVLIVVQLTLYAIFR